jgi:hypothetical protein
LYNPIINLHKNTILFTTYKISDDFYAKKRRNSLIASIILTFTGIGIIVAIPTWIFLSKTKTLLRQEESVVNIVNKKSNNKVISIIAFCIIGLIVFFVLTNNRKTNSENKPNTIENVVEEELVAEEVVVEESVEIERTDTITAENGNIIKRKFVDNKVERSYEYDSRNYLIEEIFYSEGRRSVTDRYKYDNKGNKIEKYTYICGLYSKHTYKYDSKNNLIEECRYGANSELKYMDTYKYNSKGIKIEHRYFNIDYSGCDITITKYDREGYEIEKKKEHVDRKNFQKYGLNRKHTVTLE